jgi:hypothetical protein
VSSPAVETTEGELRFETARRDRVVRATFFGVFEKKNKMKRKNGKRKMK